MTECKKAVPLVITKKKQAPPFAANNASTLFF